MTSRATGAEEGQGTGWGGRGVGGGSTTGKQSASADEDWHSFIADCGQRRAAKPARHCKERASVRLFSRRRTSRQDIVPATLGPLQNGLRNTSGCILFIEQMELFVADHARRGCRACIW